MKKNHLTKDNQDKQKKIEIQKITKVTRLQEKDYLRFSWRKRSFLFYLKAIFF